MSRAFVKEDAEGPREGGYDLPDPASPYYEEAAAWALLEGAHRGDSVGAERATGRRWGDPALVAHVRKFLTKAQADGETRVEQLARRFLRAAGVEP